MTLVDTTLALKTEGRKALVAFLTAGYPDEESFVELVHAAADAGCDVIEIGVPFSDPIADGPVIQQASTSALKQGMTLTRALELAKTVSKENGPPLVVMSYINPILSMGVPAFAKAAVEAGVTGVILPDVPVEEAYALRPQLTDAGVTPVDLVAPTSSEDRIAAITKSAEGFLYLVSVAGVTGARTALPDSLPAFVERVRRRTDVPLYVGFGVSTAEQASSVAAHADGVVIGSRLIELATNGTVRHVHEFLSEVRGALDS